MKISKTLFKNLARCSSFIPLYDMYIYKNAHHLKRIFDYELLDETSSLEENLFNDLSEYEMEIFNHMFDETTGADLTTTPLADQTALLYPHYLKVEEVALAIFKKVTNAKKVETQKHFSFACYDHEYHCYLDIYHESEDVIKIIEVKATTSNAWMKLKYQKEAIFQRNGCFNILLEDLKPEVLNDHKYLEERKKLFDKNSKVGKYIYDLAIERMIVEASLREQNEAYKIPKVKYYLAILNSNYVLNKDVSFDEIDYPNVNGEEVINYFDLTQITAEWQHEIKAELNSINKALNNLALDKIEVGNFCKKPNECPFQKVCFRKCANHHSVLELMETNFLAKCQLINQQKYQIIDVDDNALGKKQRLQKNLIINDSKYLNQKNVARYIEEIKYPIYHLDFETFTSPLPRFVGEKPYTQSLFQFSIHIEKEKGKCDKIKDHFEYISPDASDHRLDLAKKLIEIIDLSNGGTVLVYNESFEKTRIKELCSYYPSLKDSLLKIHDHIYDLMFVLKGNKKLNEKYQLDDDLYNYYHAHFYGTFSIKKVLPALTSVSYQDLAIKNGSEAIVAYALMAESNNKEDYLKIRDNLSQYCMQDTWSMVEILTKIKEEINFKL